MYHYTYLISYTTGMYYIGVRSCSCLPSEDKNYLGSSKHTPDDLVIEKRILKVFPSRELAVEHEIKWQNKMDIPLNPKFYNRAKQTSTKFDTSGIKLERTAEHNNKIKLALTGRIRSQAERDSMSKARKGKPRNFRFSEEGKVQLSAMKTGKPNTIEEYSFDARKKHYSSRTKDLTKYHWINDITGQTAYETYVDMGYLYGEKSKSVKPPVPFRKMAQGKQKSYKGWRLNTDMN